MACCLFVKRHGPMSITVATMHGLLYIPTASAASRFLCVVPSGDCCAQGRESAELLALYGIVDISLERRTVVNTCGLTHLSLSY